MIMKKLEVTCISTIIKHLFFVSEKKDPRMNECARTLT